MDAVRIGVISSALSPEPRRVPEIARRLGVPGLLFDAFSPSLSIPELSQSGRREFRHLLSSQQRELIGLRLSLGPTGLSAKADVDQQLSKIENAMDAARGLGAPLVCVDLGPLPAAATSGPTKPAVTQEMAGLILLPSAVEVAAVTPAEEKQTPADLTFISHLDPTLRELGHRADRYSVMLAFSSDLAPISAIERTIKSADCPWFGIDLDPVSLLRDKADLDAAFARVGPLIRHVRAKDAIRGTGSRTQPAVIGRGGVDWRHLLANLNAADYQGWVTIDPLELPDRLRATNDGITFLKSL
jgi:sugar phosphate isomerase/epimerase